MYASLSNYASFITEKNTESYSDIILPPRWFPPLYHYTNENIYSIDTHRFSILNPIKPFHQKSKHTHYGEQEITLVTIPNGGREYKFYSDCCQLDAVSYLKQDTIHDAVAINGVFYQFNTDYAPLGGYKLGNNEVIRELQPAYKPFYRAITISHDGLLNIDSRPLEKVWDERDTYHSVMACAPLLIDQGEICINDTMLEEETHDGVHILQCEISKPDERGSNIKRGNKMIKSCSNNIPGGLFHAANSNPRSVLIIDKKGTVYFMRSAGRMADILGMDLVQVAQSIKRFIPEAWMAINLDGGAPSQILHKKGGQVSSTTNQYTHTRGSATIIIGNIISYMKVSDDFSLLSSLPK
jgi:Phosphodiester glycosidase